MMAMMHMRLFFGVVIYIDIVRREKKDIIFSSRDSGLIHRIEKDKKEE
jgi:hypothetical protein